MPFADYLAEAVLGPLGMTATTLRGSPAHQMRSTAADVARFVVELRSPQLIAPATADDGCHHAVPRAHRRRAGRRPVRAVPVGARVRDPRAQAPHWTGTTNSPATFGHFGGAGTFLWVDPARGWLAVALTDRASTTGRTKPCVCGRRSATPCSPRPGGVMFRPAIASASRPPATTACRGPLRLRRRRVGQRRSGGGDARRRAQWRRRRPVRVATGDDHQRRAVPERRRPDDEPELRQGLVALWHAEADTAGLDVDALRPIGDGKRESDDSWAWPN